MHARALGRALVLVVLFAGHAPADPIRQACGELARALGLDDPPPALPRN